MQNENIGVVRPVSQHETARIPSDRFSRSCIFWTFTIICRNLTIWLKSDKNKTRREDTHHIHTTHTKLLELWCSFSLSFQRRWIAHYILMDLQFILQFILRYSVQNLVWLNRFLIQNMSVLSLAWIFCFQLNIKPFSFYLLSQSAYTYLNCMKLSSIPCYRYTNQPLRTVQPTRCNVSQFISVGRSTC